MSRIHGSGFKVGTGGTDRIPSFTIRSPRALRPKESCSF